MKQEIESLKQDIALLAPGREVKIVAATKTQTIQRMNEILEYGLNTVGENRVQELLGKYTPDTELEWHFIGALQTNKVKYIAGKVALIQSLDSLTLAKEIQKQCEKIGKAMPVLVEVNIGREEQKRGVSEENLFGFIDSALMFPGLKISGLMTVMPIGAPEKLFEKMRALYEKCKASYPKIEWKWLSMGMSADYKAALKHGSNMIRVGEKIFGKRT